MHCDSCRSDNPPEARFCMQCGGALEEAAPPSPAEREPRDYTPRHLAEKILTSRGALEGERKQVTVLFADVKSSVELSSALDPEEWHRVLDGFFQILAEGVHRFEGTVNQYTGDGIMALFGAPIAHEDHAQRACYAALHLRDRLRDYTEELKRERGLAFSVRMALNSGDVVVGKIGDDLRMDYTAQGLVVGLAARLQELCESGQVYASEHTAQLVSGYFELRDLGAFRLKGVAEPVGCFELSGVGALRSRFDLSRARGLSRFVGRAHEMASLEAELTAALEGRGGVVGVVAEAGVGKSRLCFEFIEKCRARGIAVYQGQAVSYGKSVPLVPIRRLMQSFFGVDEAEGESEARRKIAGTLVLLDDVFRESLPLLLDLLGAPDPARPLRPMDPGARQRRTLQFLKELVRARSRQEPGVLFLEDLHWFDPASEELLEALIDSAEDTRTLVLANFRPEFRAAWMERESYRSIALEPLGPETTAALLRALLGEDPSVLPLFERIQQRTAGNPLFTEEVVRSLAEGGVLRGERGRYRLAAEASAIEVPESVQALLAARIDRLPEEAKSLLQTAAVVGETSTMGVLERATGLESEELDRRVEVLQHAGLLYEAALYPERELAFAHPLTQEVAYRSQLKEVRQRTHALVAEALEALSPEQVEARASLLARHWDEAGEALRAARWYERAASSGREWQAASLLHSWERALELVRELPETPETAALRVRACIGVLFSGWRLVIPEETAQQVFDEGTEVAGRLGDDASRVELNSAFALLRSLHGDFGAQLVLLDEALSWVTDATELPTWASIHQRLGWTYLMAGDPTRGLDYCERGLARCGDDWRAAGHVGGYSSYGTLLAQRGLALGEMGRVEGGLRDVERALQLARAEEDQLLDMLASSFACEVHVLRGDLDTALAHATRCFEVGQEMGSGTWRIYGIAYMIRAHVERGEWSDALDHVRRALEASQETGIRWSPFNSVLRATALLGAGEREEAGKAIEEARRLARETGAPITGLEALYAARVSHALGTPDASPDDADLTEVLAGMKQAGQQAMVPLVHLELAERARQRGDEQRGRAELQLAGRLFREMGLTRRVQAVDDALAS
jgi:class 3 adenylate cyclase/tetratricopeptide (TPR) repeat protein